MAGMDPHKIKFYSRWRQKSKRTLNRFSKMSSKLEIPYVEKTENSGKLVHDSKSKKRKNATIREWIYQKGLNHCAQKRGHNKKEMKKTKKEKPCTDVREAHIEREGALKTKSERPETVCKPSCHYHQGRKLLQHKRNGQKRPRRINPCAELDLRAEEKHEIEALTQQSQQKTGNYKEYRRNSVRGREMGNNGR